jgi:hypothetical protein
MNGDLTRLTGNLCERLEACVVVVGDQDVQVVRRVDRVLTGARPVTARA